MVHRSTNILERVVLDRDSPVPLYHQLFLDLRRLITEGLLSPGDPLPRSEDLCSGLGLSTITASRAVGELKRDGLISTRRGHGTFVSEWVMPATELVLCFGYVTPSAEQDPFLQLLLTGFRRPFDESRRRCILTQYDSLAPTAKELKAVMRLRHVDSLAFYRPHEAILPALREVAKDCATVGILKWASPDAGDCVLSAPEEPLRQLLETRFRQGGRSLVYAGKAELHREGPPSPYARMLSAFDAWTEEKDIERGRYVLEDASPHGRSETKIWQDDAVLAERVGVLAPGTLVVAETPHVAAEIRKKNPGVDLIAYTESLASVTQFRADMTLLYLGLDKAAEAAARLLIRRLADSRRPREVVKLAPEVLERETQA